MASTCVHKLWAVEVTTSSTFNKKLAARSKSKVVDQVSWNLNPARKVTSLCIFTLRKIFGFPTCLLETY